MRALIIIVPHPIIDPLTGLIKISSWHLAQAFIPQALPKPLDFSTGLRMTG